MTSLNLSHRLLSETNTYLKDIKCLEWLVLVPIKWPDERPHFCLVLGHQVLYLSPWVWKDPVCVFLDASSGSQSAAIPKIGVLLHLFGGISLGHTSILNLRSLGKNLISSANKFPHLPSMWPMRLANTTVLQRCSEYISYVKRTSFKTGCQIMILFPKYRRWRENECWHFSFFSLNLYIFDMLLYNF